MPTPRAMTRRNPEEKQSPRKHNQSFGKRSVSFHGGSPLGGGGDRTMLRRPSTQPDLIAGRRKSEIELWGSEGAAAPPRLTKLLVNVTVQRSLGAVQVVAVPESTVGELVAAAVRQYVKEGRRPLLRETDPAGFDLHYSQFSLERLDPNEKLIGLGSRNFFLCPRDTVNNNTTTCSNQAEKPNSKSWLRFMDFLL
ncbi:hypothetical protein AMTRI_Chr11g93440 [Amborella trichopoda]